MRIRQRLYRERRRLAFVILLAAVSGYLLYCRAPVEIAGLPLGVVTGALYAVAVGGTSLFLCLFMPTLRFALEAFAVSRLIYASLAATFPAFGSVTLNAPLLNATIVVAGGTVLSLLFFSDWFARYARRRECALSGMAQADPHITNPPRQAREALLRELNYVPGGVGPRAALYRLLHESHFDHDPRLPKPDRVGARLPTLIRIRQRNLAVSTLAAAWLDDSVGRFADHAWTQPQRPAMLSSKTLAA